jgi:hypothetical protein
VPKALRSLAVATLVVATAALGAASLAAAATVTLRVEGSQQTLFEGPVSTQPHEIDAGDGSGPHPCSGGLGAAPGPTATGALDDGARAAGLSWRGSWNPDFYDFFVDAIGPDSSAPPEGYWGLFVDGSTSGGGCTTKVGDGDEVLWVYGAVFKSLLLKLSGPSTAAIGQPFTVTVTAGGQPVANATVGGVLTDAAGRATIVSYQATRLQLKAERSDAIRSNGLAVCVGIEVGCAASGSAGGGGAGDSAGGPVAARVAIGKLAPGSVFARGAAPRILRGTASGVSRVSLQLRRRGGSPRRLGAAVGDGTWQARIGRLPPGAYRLRASAAGAAASAAVGFRVLSRRGRLAPLLRRGLAYLERAQRRGGGFGVAAGARPSLEMGGWATAALAAQRPAAATSGLAFLRRSLRAADSTADQVRTAFAAASAEPNPGFAALLCRRLVQRRGPGASFGGQLPTAALAVLAMHGLDCGAALATRTARWLRRQGNDDDGFGYRAGVPSDVDTTGLVTWALATTPATRPATGSAVEYLLAAQNYDGGFGSALGSPSNAQSTGLALAALRAAGFAPAVVRTEDGIDPVDYLTTVQRGPGAISYSRQGRQAPVWTTAQALLGLGRRLLLPGS